MLCDWSDRTGSDRLNHFARLALKGSGTKKEKDRPEDGQAPLFIELPNPR